MRVQDPNNIRNRWRRYRAARKAYRFSSLPFRHWAQVSAPDSYSAGPIDLNVEFVDLLRGAR